MLNQHCCDKTSLHKKPVFQKTDYICSVYYGKEIRTVFLEQFKGPNFGLQNSKVIFKI